MLWKKRGIMLDDLTEDQYLKREVFAYYGRASYYAQCLEKSIITLLSIKRVENDINGFDKIDIFFDTDANKTFGSALKTLKEIYPELTILFANEMKEAKENRDNLAHNYWWEKAIDILHQDQYTSMIEELDSKTKLFIKMDGLIMDCISEHRKMHGITDEMYARLVRKETGIILVPENDGV